MLRTSLKDMCIHHGRGPVPEPWATKRPEQLKPAEFISLTTDLFGTIATTTTTGSGSGSGSSSEGGGLGRPVWRRAAKGNSK
jgi:hypothetical protein